MNDNVKKFFERYKADPAIQKKVADAEAMYPGSLELREPLVRAVLLPVAEELGLGFSVTDLREYEIKLKALRSQNLEADGAGSDLSYWLLDRGWSNDESRFCGDKAPEGK